MYTDPRHRDAFVATLPIAGKDGTIATRMRRTRAEGNALAKTGSIANVRSLSGYVRTRDGEMLVFSILANDFVIPAATVNWIADLGVEVLANFTRRPAKSDRSASCWQWSICRLRGCWRVAATGHLPPRRPARRRDSLAARATQWLEPALQPEPTRSRGRNARGRELGAAALPVIQQALRDPQRRPSALKAALKACGILGQDRGAGDADVAAVLPEPGLTAEAAIALSYMGPDAFAPLRDALSSDDPIVRRESLRSIGKLKNAPRSSRGRWCRCSSNGMKDRDEGVRTVAATYLGIIHAGARTKRSRR